LSDRKVPNIMPTVHQCIPCMFTRRPGLLVEISTLANRNSASCCDKRMHDDDPSQPLIFTYNITLSVIVIVVVASLSTKLNQSRIIGKTDSPV